MGRNMDRIGVAIVGAGGIAALWHLPELAGIADFEVRVLAGRRASRLRTLQQRFGGRCTHDYLEAIRDPRVDAVVVSTPHPQHLAFGIEVLKAGKHLLLQKPMCGDLAEAEPFCELSAKARTVVMCLPHFRPEVIETARRVAAGDIGTVSGAYARTSHGGPEIYYAEARDAFGETDTDLWFFDAKRASVGALFDMGVYAVSMLVTVLGSVTAVDARATTVAKPTPLEDSGSVLLEFARGCVGTAETSWCDPGSTWMMQVHGTKGKLVSGIDSQRPLLRVTPSSTTREKAAPVVEAIDLEPGGIGSAHEHWRDCIRSNQQPVKSTWQSARHVTEILLAALESSRRRQPIPVRSRVE